MASSENNVCRFEQRAKRADEMISLMRADLNAMRQFASRATKNGPAEITRFKAENESLEQQVKTLLEKLKRLEVLNGIPQIQIPEGTGPAREQPVENNKTEKLPPKDAPPQLAAAPHKEKVEKPAKTKANPKGTQEEEEPPHVGRLNLRIGRILKAQKHPDADSLYVEEIDLGEPNPRTVVSGLVKFIPIEQMQNKMVVCLCNLKPAKMRGITSEAMVMCASTPDKVEMLVPPEGSVPGERVVCEQYPGEPDGELNPKKKVWEKIAPDLKTDLAKVATYKGHPLGVPNRGVVVAPTLVNVIIK